MDWRAVAWRDVLPVTWAKGPHRIVKRGPAYVVLFESGHTFYTTTLAHAMLYGDTFFHRNLSRGGRRRARRIQSIDLRADPPLQLTRGMIHHERR